MPLGVDETSEWCNSFVLVSKANGILKLCLDPLQLISSANKTGTQGTLT